MPEYTLPYGKTTLRFHIPESYRVDWIAPPQTAPAADPHGAVLGALSDPLGGFDWSAIDPSTRVAIAVNDKTRPVPHDILLPPLLNRLEAAGIPPSAIHFLIATGTHSPMRPEEFPAILPAEILARYQVSSHDCDDSSLLEYCGTTAAGTPMWVNRHYMSAGLRIVIGNIEPHQFQGFSGGVKSAAIGLAGRESINHNHAMMVDPDSRLGEYAHNPARQDVGEMGALIGVHLAVNAILNQEKQIVRVLAGEPKTVLETGIPLARQICQVPVSHTYDLVIASPGGHPKDINLYQSQKGLAHACMITRPGGALLLVAACPEGTGSRGYERWMEGIHSHTQVLELFANSEFRIGPHKAFQIARDATRVNLQTYSEFPPELARRYLLNPVQDLQVALDRALSGLPPDGRVAIMPRASATIPDLHVLESASEANI